LTQFEATHAQLQEANWSLKQELMQETMQATQQAQQIHAERDGLQLRMGQVQRAVAELENRNQAQEQQAQAWQHEHQRAAQHTQQLRVELNEAQKGATAQAAQATAAAHARHEQISRAEAAAQDTHNNVVHDLASYKTEVNELRDRLQASEARLQKGSNGEGNAFAVGPTTGIPKLCLACPQKQAKIDQLNATVRELTQELTDARTERDGLRNQGLAAVKENRDLEASCRQLQQRHVALQSQYEEQESSFQQGYSDLRQQNQALESEIETLRTESRSNGAVQQERTNQKLYEQNFKLQGMIEALNNVIERGQHNKNTTSPIETIVREQWRNSLSRDGDDESSRFSDQRSDKASHKEIHLDKDPVKMHVQGTRTQTRTATSANGSVATSATGAGGKPPKPPNGSEPPYGDGGGNASASGTRGATRKLR